MSKVGASAPCPKCGSEEVEKLWSLGTRPGPSAFPYTTTNLTNDGSRVEVKSAKHLEQLCKKYGKTHRPDASWVNKTYVGYDWKTKKQIYSEGSGRGMPGSW